MTAEAARGRGRPRIGRPITVRIDDQTHARLEQLARADDVPVAEIARRLITGACPENAP